MKTKRLNLYFLGSPKIKLDDQPVEIHLHKALALLAFLAISGQDYRRDTLATFFWPDCSQGQARSYLRNALWVLKEHLGESWFLVYREEVGLKPEASIWVDVHNFQEHLKAVEHHQILHPSNHLCSICCDHLTNAVNLYRDDFLSGFSLRNCPAFDEWQGFYCEDLRQGMGNALERLALWFSCQGNNSASITYARRLILFDPYNEKARQVLMEAYYQTRHRADALQQYQEYAQILQRDLNALPSTEITKLYESMREDSIKFTDREQLKATRKGDSPDAFADAALRKPVPFIPPLIFPIQDVFVKREHVLENLRNHLQASIAGHGRNILISGASGSGKTALALEFIRRAQNEFPDLVVSGGACLPQTGTGNPYFVFQKVLSLLAGEVEQRWAEPILTPENLNRLFNFLPTVLQTLIDSSPDLITAFLPTLNLSSKEWAYKNQSLNAASLMVKWFLQDFHIEETTPLDQELIFKQYLKTLCVLAAQQPLLLILDDLHWSDPSSIRLLSHLRQHIGSSRIIIIGTCCRQELEGEWQQNNLAFNELINASDDRELWIDLDQTVAIEGQEFTNAFLALEPHRLSERFHQELYKTTGGHPLFLTEYLQDLKNNGNIYRDEQNCWTDTEILYSRGNQPDSVEAVIKTRISRLPVDTRKAIEAASIEGIEFSLETVASALKMNPWELVQLLNQDPNHPPFVIPLSLYQSGPQRLSWFRFRHSLYQTCVYNQIDQAERSYLHGEIGVCLERTYSDRVEEICNQLSWHFQEGGNTLKAKYYYQMAGKRAKRLGAKQEFLWLSQQAESA